MRHKWNKKEIDFLQKYYPIYGLDYCHKKLEIPINKLKSQIGKLKLTLKDKTDVSLFTDIKTKEVAYIMGLLWSDGNINNKYNNYEVRIESNIDDMMNIENTIMKTGNWKKYIRVGRLRNSKICKETMCYSIGFKKFYEIFKNYDYELKSQKAPTKILNSLPENLKNYFFRGIIDGDGCFYMNKNQYTYQFTLGSTFEQDWSYMIELCEKLNISKYRIDKIKKTKGNKPSSSSSFRICRRCDIKILGEYIYKNYDLDKIGLERKNKKYNLMIK